jgi:hypothetical protein
VLGNVNPVSPKLPARQIDLSVLRPEALDEGKGLLPSVPTWRSKFGPDAPLIQARVDRAPFSDLLNRHTVYSHGSFPSGPTPVKARWPSMHCIDGHQYFRVRAEKAGAP